MRPYEIVVIFDVSIEENAIREMTDRVVDLVRTRGGKPGRVDRWGRRTFAYELKHQTEGYYVFIEVSAEPEVVAEVDRLLALSDAVLRHRVIRQPEHKVVTKASPAVAPATAVETAPVPEAETAPAG